MSIRSIAALIAVATFFGVPAAFAFNHLTPENNVVGGKPHAMPGSSLRAQVKPEVETPRREGTVAQTTADASSQRAVPATQSGPLTREQVKRELQRWQANPVTADGYREVKGDIVWIREAR